MLEGRDLWKSYGNGPVLQGVTIGAVPGSATVLIGPSGSGKSTTLRTLSLVDPPDGGVIRLDDVILYGDRAVSAPRPWPQLTVVLQQLFLWPHLSIRRNIALPSRLRGYPEDELEELASHLGIRDILDRYPNEASVGQRQRAAVARALLLKPRYLMLDEITASLDVEQIHAMLRLLEQKLDAGVGLIVVTHQLGFARRLLERGPVGTFAFLDGGTVVEEGDLHRFENPLSGRLQEFRRALTTVS